MKGSIKNLLLLLVLTLIFLPAKMDAQLFIHIESLSNNTPADASIYFAGNINGWDPSDEDFKLDVREGDYWINLPEGSGTIEFKFTRGSWATVESNGSGGYRPNRQYTYGNGDTLHLSILGWEDLDGSGPNSTANNNVQVWDDAFFMPQLNRERRIWLYLPTDYENSNRYYPVLYMHDGQNVFDAATSFIGEWKVDESLFDMEEEGYPGIIVVAIDNGGAKRIDEYSPFINAQYGGGEGDAYLDFIIHTLKPKIDSSFRTLKEARFTGIMGSSMGGLISHYAHFRDPAVFGRAGIFSPAYWFSDQYFTFTEEKGKTQGAKLYLLAGALESSIASGTQEMGDQLIEMGYTDDELLLLIPADGQHSEWFWAREFKDAISWLFPAVDIMEVNNPSVNKAIMIYPNPADSIVTISGAEMMEVEIYNSNGKLLLKKELANHEMLDLSKINISGKLLIKVSYDGKVYTQQLLKL